MSCSGIFQAQSVSCDTPLGVGVTQEVFLCNLDDIDHVVMGGNKQAPYAELNRTNVVEEIVLKATKKFYRFGGVSQTISAQSEKLDSALSVQYKHTVNISVFEVDNESLLNMQAMAYKPQVAIVIQPNDDSFGNGGITIYGLGAGLEVITNTRILADADTGGAHVIQLATPTQGAIETNIPNPYVVQGFLQISAALTAGAQTQAPAVGDQIDPTAMAALTDVERYAYTLRCIKDGLTVGEPNYDDDTTGTVYQWDGATPPAFP